jgi:GAF domain-containing protein
MIGMERLADVFVEVADTLVADFDLMEFLRSVASHASEVSESATVGVMLSDHEGRLHYMGASSEDAHVLELLQIQNDEGPCLDCFRTGEPVVHLDLAVDPPWPRFAARAGALGIVSVHAFPLRLRERVIGALNVFLPDPRILAPDEARVIQALADCATIAIIQERAIARAEVVTEQLQAALSSRIVIEQAKGAVARTFGVSVDVAFELIRRHARATNQRLAEVSHLLVTDRTAMDALRQD